VWTPGCRQRPRASRCDQKKVMADAFSLLSNDTRYCIFDRHDASTFWLLKNAADARLRFVFFGSSIDNHCKYSRAEQCSSPTKNATIGASKKYQEAFGDIQGSGQNARVLATSPMHETIRILHQSKVNLEPIRDPA
jgi:hypothetical protein